MSQLLRTLTLGASVLCLYACATTTFVSTWKAPDAQQVSPVGKTIAAVFVSRDESKRRVGEDALAADLTARGAHGIAAYTLLPNDQRGNVEAARERLKAAGADGVVVMRVIGKDQKITYTPGYASTFPVTTTSSALIGLTGGVRYMSPATCKPTPWSQSKPWSIRSSRTSSSGRARATPRIPQT